MQTDIVTNLLRDPEESVHVRGPSEKSFQQDETEHDPQAVIGGHVVVQDLTQYHSQIGKLWTEI